MADRPAPLLAWFGDDMSGSIDVMEALHAAGVRSVLLLGEPDPVHAVDYPDALAVGWAGETRGLRAAEIRRHTARATQAMISTGAAVVHHKVCSTFDSSPDVGSIGAALETAQDIAGAALVPVLAAAPRLHRWTCFGNLFARSGWSSPVYRLDRHPTMSRHPVTPMHEADLRLILKEQTDRPAGLLDLTTLRRGAAACAQRLDELQKAGCRIAVCDAVDEDDMHVLGELLWDRAGSCAPVLAVGSAGVEHALTAHWRAAGIVCASAPLQERSRVNAVLAVSGTRSPVMRRQLVRAREAGWAEVALDASVLRDHPAWATQTERAVSTAASCLSEGTSVVVHTLSGELTDLGVDGRRRLGTALGELARAVLAKAPAERLVVVGGDSSGHMLRAMGVSALEAVAPFAPAMPFCRVHGESPVDGVELVCKGGQIGGDDLFEEIRAGRPFINEIKEMTAGCE